MKGTDLRISKAVLKKMSEVGGPGKSSNIQLQQLRQCEIGKRIEKQIEGSEQRAQKQIH